MSLDDACVRFGALFGIKKLRTGHGNDLPLVCRGTDAQVLKVYPEPAEDAGAPESGPADGGARRDEYWTQASMVAGTGFPFPTGAHVSQEPAVPPGEVAHHTFVCTAQDGNSTYGICVTEWRRIEKRTRRHILRMQAAFLPIAVEHGARRLGNGFAVQRVANEIQADDAQVKFLMNTPTYEPVTACVVINCPTLELARAVVAAAVARRQDVVRAAADREPGSRRLPVVCPALAGAMFADVTVALRALLTPPRLPSGFGKRDAERAERLMLPVPAVVPVNQAAGSTAPTLFLSRWVALGPLLDNGAARVKEQLTGGGEGGTTAAAAEAAAGATAAFCVPSPAPGFEPGASSEYAGYDLDLARLHDAALLRGARRRQGGEGRLGIEGAAGAAGAAAGVGSPLSGGSTGEGDGSRSASGEGGGRAAVGRVSLAYCSEEDARVAAAVARSAPLPLVDVNWHPLLSRLSPRNIARLVHAVLLQKHILLLGRDVSVFVDVAEAVLSLCQPMQWAYQYFPLMPPVPGLIDIMGSPTPLIMGMHTAMLARATSDNGKVFAPPGPPPPLGDPRNMLPSGRGAWERWCGTLQGVLKEMEEEEGEDEEARGGGEAIAFRALRRMWPLAVDQVPSTNGIPLLDVVLPRDRRRRRKALRRAAGYRGLSALVVQGLASPSAVEAGDAAAGGGGGGDVSGSDSDEADESDPEGVEGAGEAGRSALPSRRALSRLAHELGLPPSGVVVDLDHDWVSSPGSTDLALPARLTMRLFRALALHAGATAFNPDTFEQVVAPPDLPSLTTGSEREGLVRDTSAEAQFVCKERVRDCEAVTEYDVNLGTCGVGRAGAPVIGVHIDKRDAEAVVGVVGQPEEATVALGMSGGEDEDSAPWAIDKGAVASADPPAPKAPESFLAETQPCAAASIDVSLSGHPLRLLSKSAGELRRELEGRVEGRYGGVGSVPGEVDQEGMPPVRHGALPATGHGQGRLYRTPSAFERRQIAAMGPATASIMQGELDGEMLVNQAPAQQPGQLGLGPTGPQEAEAALSVGCAFADGAEEAEWAAVQAAARAYDRMPRHGASLVSCGDRARLFPVRSERAHMAAYEAPWAGWRDRLLKRRFEQSLAGVGAPAPPAPSEGGTTERTGAEAKEAGSAGALAIRSPPADATVAASGAGSPKRQLKTSRLQQLARRILSVYPDDQLGNDSDKADEGSYLNERARGLRWDEGGCGGDAGSQERRCVRRLLAAARPIWWKFRASDRNPDTWQDESAAGDDSPRVEAPASGAGGAVGSSRLGARAIGVPGLLRGTEASGGGHGASDSLGDDGLSASLDASSFPVPQLSAWDEDGDGGGSGEGDGDALEGSTGGGSATGAGKGGGEAGAGGVSVVPRAPVVVDDPGVDLDSLPRGCGAVCRGIASLPREGRTLLSDFDVAPAEGEGWRPDVSLVRVIMGSVLVSVLKAFRLYIKEEPSVPRQLAAQDSDQRPRPQEGVLRLDDTSGNLNSQFRAAFDANLFVAEQPGDMGPITRLLTNDSQAFRCLLEERVSPALRTSVSAMRRLSRTGEVPKTVDWFDLWCFERMQASARRLEAVREKDFSGELHMARRGTAVRLFDVCYVRLVGNVLAWYRDPQRIIALQTAQRRLRREVRRAPPGSSQLMIKTDHLREAKLRLDQLFKANLLGFVQVGRDAKVQAGIEQRKRQLDRLERQLMDGSCEDAAQGAEEAKQRKAEIARRETEQAAAEAWQLKCVTVEQAELPTPFAFQLVRPDSAATEGRGAIRSDMLSMCAVHAEDRRDLLARLRARLHSAEYLEHLRKKYISPTVGEGTRELLAGNRKKVLLDKLRQAAKMAAAKSGGAGGGAGAASGAGSGGGGGGGVDPAAWLHGRVRWSEKGSGGGAAGAQIVALEDLQEEESKEGEPGGSKTGRKGAGRREGAGGAEKPTGEAAASGPAAQAGGGGIGGFFRGMFRG